MTPRLGVKPAARRRLCHGRAVWEQGGEAVPVTPRTHLRLGRPAVLGLRRTLVRQIRMLLAEVLAQTIEAAEVQVQRIFIGVRDSVADRPNPTLCIVYADGHPTVVTAHRFAHVPNARAARAGA